MPPANFAHEERGAQHVRHLEQREARERVCERHDAPNGHEPQAHKPPAAHRAGGAPLPPRRFCLPDAKLRQRGMRVRGGKVAGRPTPRARESRRPSGAAARTRERAVPPPTRQAAWAAGGAAPTCLSEAAPIHEYNDNI